MTLHKANDSFPYYPSLYQINTRVWLTALSPKLGRPATLDDIPDAELDRLAELGFDWEWFLVCAWHGPSGEHLVVTVNYAPNQSQCYVRLPFTDLGNSHWRLEDMIAHAIYDREGNDLQARGLYLDEPPWKASAFSLTKRD